MARQLTALQFAIPFRARHTGHSHGEVRTAEAFNHQLALAIPTVHVCQPRDRKTRRVWRAALTGANPISDRIRERRFLLAKHQQACIRDTSLISRTISCCDAQQHVHSNIRIQAIETEQTIIVGYHIQRL